MIKKDSFQLLHISLLREYLCLEFRPHVPDTFAFNLEKVLDDCVAICFLVGNDFLPHLPFLQINDGGLQTLFQLYVQMLITHDSSDPWICSSCGDINFKNLGHILKIYAEAETKEINTSCKNHEFLFGAKRHVGIDVNKETAFRKTICKI